MAIKVKKLFNDFFNKAKSSVKDDVLLDLMMAFSTLVLMLLMFGFIIFVSLISYDIFNRINSSPRKFDVDIRTYELKQSALRHLNKLDSQNNEVKNEN